MPQLDDVVQDYEARTERYVRDVVQAAREADRFGDRNSEAAMAARQMGMAAQEAGERAGRSQREAAEAALRFARGEETAERATQAAVRAQRDLARAEISQTRAANAAARAADQQGDQYRQLAREAALAAAAQRLAQLRAAGQTEEHDRLLTHLRNRYGDLGKQGGGAFDLIGKKAEAAGESMTSPKGGAAKVAVALGLLPWAATAAGSAITLGVGGALVGLGLKAAYGSKAVQREIDGLKKHVKDESKDLGKPFEHTWMVMADAARDTFDELIPDVRASLGELAPAADAFVDDAIRSFREFGPALDDVADAAGPLLNTLGNEMPGLMGRVADTISRIAKSADPEMFAGMIDGLGVLITGAGHAISVLSKLTGVFTKFGPLAIAARNIDEIGSAVNRLTGQSDIGKEALEGFEAQLVSYDLGASAAAGATTLMAAGMSGASGQVGTLGSTMRLASMTAAQLRTELDRLAGKTLTSRAAARAYQQAVDDATKSVKENGRTLNINSEAGRKNEQALDNLVTAAHAQAAAFRDSKMSAEDVAKGLAEARRKFIATSIAMGDTRKHATQVADKLFGVKRAADKIPPKKNVNVTAQTGQARSAINQLIAEMSARTISIGVNLLGGGLGYAHGGPVGYATGGPIPGFPGGGLIRGAGTGTSDSNLIAASTGEYIVNAAETTRWRPLIEAVNSGALSKAARLSSAKATAPTLTARASQTLAPARAQQVVQVTNNWYVSGTVLAERQLVELAQSGLAGRSVNNGGNAGIAPGRRP